LEDESGDFFKFDDVTELDDRLYVADNAEFELFLLGDRFKLLFGDDDESGDVFVLYLLFAGEADELGDRFK
jgi:hypothetical protein